MAAAIALTETQILKDRSAFGGLLETFVFSEVIKQAGWSDESYDLHYYRDKDQDEIDVVVEDQHGALVAIQVKASATVRATDFKAMKKLREFSGTGFKLGVVLYDGEKAGPFGDRLFAAPISCLWN